jgi:hypothetical protein
MRTIIFLFVTLCFSVSCQNRSNLNSQDKENSLVILTNKLFDSASIDTIFPKRKFIPLEANSECLLGSLDKAIIIGESILILDKMQSTIFLFNINGKFIAKYKKFGKGPGEYREINDINFSNDTGYIYLLVDNSRFIILNLKLEFVTEKKLTIDAVKFAVMGKELFAFYAEYFPNAKFFQTTKPQLIITDKTEVIGLFENTISSRIGFSPQSAFSFSDKIIFNYPMSYEAYEVLDGKLGVKILFEFPERNYNYEEFRSINSAKVMETIYGENDKITYIQNIFIFGNLIYYSVLYQHQIWYGIFDSLKRTSYLVKRIIDNKDEIPLGRIVGTFENGIITEIVPTDFVFSKVKRSGTFIDTIKAEDNNIIILNYVKK